MDLLQAVLVAAVFGGILIGAVAGSVIGIMITLNTVVSRLSDIASKLDRVAAAIESSGGRAPHGR